MWPGDLTLSDLDLQILQHVRQVCQKPDVVCVQTPPPGSAQVK